MKRLHSSLVAFAIAGLVAATAGTAAAADKLTYYCSAEEEWCQLMAKEFAKATGIKVAMTRKSSGETFAQIRAERRNPKGDVWWGGTGDPHLQAAEEGLTQVYKSPRLGELLEWAQRQAAAGRATRRWESMPAPSVSATTPNSCRSTRLAAPKCWMDLTKPEYKGHVQMANPNSSGTAYTTLATIIQVFGEDKGFDFMKGLHKNINQYTKSGSAPIKASARGETTLAVVFPARRGETGCQRLPDQDHLTLRGYRV